MQDFKNKVAVITGGASGIGRAVGARLAREGAKLVLADIEAGALNKAVDEFRAQGVEAIGVVTDVTKFESMNALAEKSFAHFGAVHLLFNNAGISPSEAPRAWDSPLTDWAWGFNVNIWGVVHGIKAFMPRLVAQNQPAHVVNTSSGNGGMVVVKETPIYAATKAAVTAITEVLHLQLRADESPIRVSILFPGPHPVRTGIFNSERVRPKENPRDPNMPDTGISKIEDLQNIMANLGLHMEITTAEEVAEHVYQGLVEEKYWIQPMTETFAQAIRDRFEGILAHRDPAAWRSV